MPLIACNVCIFQILSQLGQKIKSKTQANQQLASDESSTENERESFESHGEREKEKKYMLFIQEVAFLATAEL